jgi:hypothetical protein
MGARHPEKSAVTYLKTDNSYSMTGTINGMGDSRQRSYKYSPAHQDVAVCCVPNAGRIIPYYVHNMWLKDENGFIASLLGGCDVNTHFGGHPVSIREITDYPHSNRITFEVEVKKPVRFTLKIRKPEWNRGFTLDMDYKEEGDYIVINKKWAGKINFSVEWKADIVRHEINDETYFTYGGQVLALAIESVEIPKRLYKEGFQDFEYTPQNLIIYKYMADEIPVKEGDNFKVNLYNSLYQHKELKTLVPMGQTILRQVTFRNK